MNVLTAPTNLGNRPYEDNGRARQTTDGPSRLRGQRIVQRLGARDLGDVAAAPYRDLVRAAPTRNEDLVLDHVNRIAEVIAEQKDFTLVLGGDCSTLLGCLLGLRQKGSEPALVFIDGHTDFNTPATSETGGVAGMDLALATGRGDTPLARLDPRGPLVRDEHVVTVGVRDGGFGDANIRAATNAREVLEVVGDREFFIHIDADVLDEAHMPFVDSPQPNGLAPEELTALLAELAAHPRAVGMELTIYDPRHDHDARGAKLLAGILEESLRSRRG